MKNIEAEKLQKILEELIVLGSKCIVSKHGTHTCRREYLTPLANSAKILNKAEPTKPITEPDMATSTFKTQLPQ
ncbi:hypothetical protein Goshw_029534 [Gossypium schwendimanii]|uniref:Uncharacterized protein n=1 Tax=Gossypium schwendimanii TaxID=34291 RepID=A0A7J9LJD0_GOSSC|nr:hypothetical protein [Gossypium schwendimanii]